MSWTQGFRNLISHGKAPLRALADRTQRMRLFRHGVGPVAGPGAWGAPSAVEGQPVPAVLPAKAMAEGPHVPEPEAPPAAATPVGAEEWEKFLGEIDDRLDAQTTQTRRLMEPFAGLTGAAQTLVEIKTQSARMLGLLNDHLEQARAIEATERSVDAAVGRLGDATERQSESLDKVRERVEANTQAIRRAAETYERVTEELQEVVRAICKAQEDVGTLARSLQDHDSRLARSVSRLEKRLLLLGGAASLAAVVALALGVLGLV